jgi:hypothetical protein
MKAQNELATKTGCAGAVNVLERIQNYFGNGGLFNPEMMEHGKVRDLIMDCRTCIESHHETIKWIASQQNLFFAECSQAEEIVTRCQSLLNSPSHSL